MAVIQYTGVVNQIRGKLNGSVFNKSRNAYTLQRKQQSPFGSRGNQTEVRSRYSGIQRSWSTLTPAQQNAWATTAQNNPSVDRFGDQTILSGYNQFIRCNLLRLSVGLDLLLDSFTSTETITPTTAPDLSNLNITSNEFGESIISGHVQAGGAGNIFQYGILEVSVPTSTGVTVYHRNFRRAGSGVSGNFSIQFDFNTNLGNRFPAVMPGSVLWFAFSKFGIRSGARIPKQVVRFVVPTFEALAITNFTHDSVTGQVDVEVAYTPAHVGVPPFYEIRCYYEGNTAAPLTPEQLLGIRYFAMENDLQNSNHDDFLQAVPAGRWLSLRIDFLFAQTGAILSTAYQAIQAT